MDVVSSCMSYLIKDASQREGCLLVTAASRDIFLVQASLALFEDGSELEKDWSNA